MVFHELRWLHILNTLITFEGINSRIILFWGLLKQKEGRYAMMGYLEGFEKLVSDPNLLLQLSKSVGSRTDFPLATPGMRVFWNTLNKSQGWKLQKNYYYDHCRILDEYNVRRAWGTESDMLSTLEAFTKS